MPKLRISSTFSIHLCTFTLDFLAMKILRKKKWLLIGVAIALPLLTWALWPLSGDSKWDIEANTELENGKHSYLAGLPSNAPKKPNIILILADDLGKYDISLYGGNRVHTPNIDSIAHRGVRFDQAYVTAPICAPSRAALLTGRHNTRFGMEFQPHRRYPKNRLEYFVFRHFIDTDNWQVAPQFSFPDSDQMKDQGLPASEITLAEVLTQLGYKTALYGKWHLGYEPGFHPNQRGFQDFYGFTEAYSLFADSTDPGIVNAMTDEFSDRHIWENARKGACAIMHNTTEVEEKEYLTHVFASKAKSFIRQNKEQPFFLYLPFNAPHTPFQAPKAYYDMFPDEPNHTHRVYKAMIKCLDDAVGEIMQELRKQGLEEETMVWFSSDNGAALYTLSGDNAPLKGGKLSQWEGGIQVPFMMQWKGKVAPGSHLEQPVSLTDVMVTSLAALDLPLPQDRVFDGVNLLPYVLAPDSAAVSARPSEPPHAALFWKSAFNRAMRSGNFKWMFDASTGTVQLYDLEADMGETKNLAGDLPEVQERLKSMYQNWQNQIPEAMWPGIMNHRFEYQGQVFYFRI